MHYIVIILTTTIVVGFMYYLYMVLHVQTHDLFVRRMVIQMVMLVAAVYAIPMLIEGRESEAVEIVCTYVCCAYAVQGLISLTGFLIPSFGDWLISVKAEEFQAMMNDRRRNISRYRGYVLSGSLFFELPASYGLAFIMFVRLQLIEGQKFLTGYKSVIVCFLMLIGIMICGRTGFVGVGIGVILYFLFVANPFLMMWNIFKSTVIFVPVLIIVYFTLLSPDQKKSFEKDLFPFAFEAYYNYRDYGEFRTGSTDATKGFYYSLRDETYIFGEGTDMWHSSYYPVDAGYMRTLVYGGVPFLIMLLYYQFLYFKAPISLLSSRNTVRERVDFYCCWLFYLYILVLHLKDYALGSMHLVEVMYMLFGVAVIVWHEDREEKNNTEEEVNAEEV
jgi:hypothetical protein